MKALVGFTANVNATCPRLTALLTLARANVYVAGRFFRVFFRTWQRGLAPRSTACFLSMLWPFTESAWSIRILIFIRMQTFVSFWYLILHSMKYAFANMDAKHTPRKVSALQINKINLNRLMSYFSRDTQYSIKNVANIWKSSKENIQQHRFIPPVGRIHFITTLW